MGREYESTYPNCGCSERCSKPKCRTAGGAALHLKSLVAMGFNRVGKKNSPDRLRYFLNKLAEFPNVTRTCAMAGISYTSLKYWLKKSHEGQPGDGFDLDYAEETKRFHEHYQDVLDGGVQAVEDAFFERALVGYYETLSHQGRIIYQLDQELVDLGMTGADAYLRDDHNRPIPERIHHQDPEVMLSVLKAWRRDRYGQKDQLDVMHRGGVMVIQAPVRTSVDLESAAKAQSEVLAPIDVEFVDLTELDDGAEPLEKR